MFVPIDKKIDLAVAYTWKDQQGTVSAKKKPYLFPKNDFTLWDYRCASQLRTSTVRADAALCKPAEKGEKKSSTSDNRSRYAAQSFPNCCSTKDKSKNKEEYFTPPLLLYKSL